MLNKTQGFQLSPQQKRVWLLQKENSVYRALCAVMIEGCLQVNILRKAFEKVVNRNEILRTSFNRTPGIKTPIQVIINRNTFSFEEYNYDVALENQYKLITNLFNQEKERFFELDKSSYFYVKLVQILPEKNVLIISLPSLCADTVALNNLVAEISRCYGACLQAEEIVEDTIQYADIAAWQNELLESEGASVGRNHWRQIDIPALEACKLINENRRYEEAKFEPQFISLPLDNKLVIQINKISQNYQGSAFVFLLACWIILLYRLTGQSNLIIGTAFDGRNYDELKSALGLLAKFLPLNCHLQEEDIFSDVLLKVQKGIEEIDEWQENFAWEETIAATQQDVDRLFFPFCFEFAELPTQHSSVDISLLIYQHYVCFDKFKVKLACSRTAGNGLIIQFHYDSNLFTKTDIQLLANQFTTLLGSVVENPQTIISRLEILSQSERKQLVEFNSTKAPEPYYQCIHHWFEAQCDLTPNNIAIVFENQQLTYQDLNIRANQLAHYLQNLGVGSDVLVGICVERSPLMLIGLFAILKAGGAYVPIDPNNPAERKAFILADTQISLLLTQESLAPALTRDNIKLICLDSNEDVIDQQSQVNPVSKTTSLNLAYVIYTSGSTGKPKGTLISHKGLLNYLNWCTQEYAVQQGSGTLVHSSLGFDLTITSLFSPLLVGSQVEILPEGYSIENLSNTLKQRNNLSLVKITPAHLELLSQHLSPHEVVGCTRAFIIGGENLTTQHIAFWQKFASDTILINEYGPTETVVGCSSYKVSIDQNYFGSIPIGRPIANTQLYVLDKNLRLVPVGVAGELYIGGSGLARGYLNQPELTAQKFVPNPFSNEPGERLYKTGDKVRFLLDGTLEFLGRLDDQVKVRGFRIELGEIELVLSQHPTVKDAVVIVKEDVVGDQRLVAYFVLEEKSSFSISNLRSFLKEKLPDYMLPSAFVPLQALPLTPNGKVDRRSLPAPDKVSAEVEEYFVAPRNSLEEQLTNIWAEVLRLKKVGIYNNFFDLGGHSLIVTQLVSRLRDTFGVELLVQHIFEAPTIAELAPVITQKLVEKIDSEMLAQSLSELEELSEKEVELMLADSKQIIEGLKSYE